MERETRGESRDRHQIAFATQFTTGRRAVILASFFTPVPIAPFVAPGVFLLVLGTGIVGLRMRRLRNGSPAST